ncbi:DNA-binding domain-containing protein [Roseibium sediminicola]|uniref:DNA-binding domain-containing protein n=1 Tax=Roseibium sediminicola TaxID=2933272 RepID=A0ABT0GUI6_9HYPH|nr:putative DNA-binding domain-containing protein [Roseibium sp. CAU 1639]MCK7613096.1 DNA-binding domain-containing protein [Roseibium sp. CAU 1639]
MASNPFSDTVDGNAFGAALLDPERPAPAGLVGPDGKHAPKRFNVYRNNVIVSLRDALADSFPAIKTLLGEDYFNALARAFVLAHPPTSPVLIWYGGKFPDFVEAFPPLAAYPYLADVARVEWAWLQAYHAADAKPLDPAELGALPPDAIGGACFAKHPAAWVLSSDWPVWDLLRVNRFEPGTDIVIDLATPQSVLVSRPELDVELMMLRPGADVFLQALFNGETLGEAAFHAQQHSADFSLSDSLSDCLSNGVFEQLIVNQTD